MDEDMRVCEQQAPTLGSVSKNFDPILEKLRNSAIDSLMFFLYEH